MSRNAWTRSRNTHYAPTHKFSYLVCVVLLGAFGVVENGRAASNSQTTVAFGQVWRLQREDQGPLRVLVVQDRESSQISVGIRFNSGYFYDPPGYDGLAHAVEHLMVEGTTRPFNEPIREWLRQSQSRGLHCKTLETHTNCYFSAGVEEARDLVSRVQAAFSEREFSEADIAKQLSDIDDERVAYERSSGGVALAYESSLLNAEHPAHRNFSSGATKELRSHSNAEVLSAAQAILKSRYWGLAADVVIVSPLSAANVDKLVRETLLNPIGGNLSDVRADQAPWGEAFRQSAVGKAFVTESPAQEHELVSMYAFKRPVDTTVPESDRYRALDLLTFELQAKDPQSLYGRLADVPPLLSSR